MQAYSESTCTLWNDLDEKTVEVGAVEKSRTQLNEFGY